MPDYLPLFPLDVVLFPEMLLPLHIFEERYKEMIAECLQGDSPFGVLYSHEDTVETIGCTAEIRQVLKRYPDGRLDLVAVGRKRFQVTFFDSERAYLRGSVELLPDSVGDRGPSEELARQTLDLYAQASRLMGRRIGRNSALNRLFKDWPSNWPPRFTFKMQSDSGSWKPDQKTNGLKNWQNTFLH